MLERMRAQRVSGLFRQIEDLGCFPVLSNNRRRTRDEILDATSKYLWETYTELHVMVRAILDNEREQSQRALAAAEEEAMQVLAGGFTSSME